MKMLYAGTILILWLSLGGCDAPEQPPILSPKRPSNWVAAVDLSTLPEMMADGPVFYDGQGQTVALLPFLRAQGINTVRLRLWVDPPQGHSGWAEVAQWSDTLRAHGFDTWLAVHYADTWADPSQQVTPLRWQGLALEVLRDSVYQYTAAIVQAMRPDYIQIGNEINHGLLHPQGRMIADSGAWKALLGAGIAAVRDHAPQTEVMLHYAGIAGAEWFFDQVKPLDYDLIGLSYYPKWHGKDLAALQATLEQLAATHRKDMVIAETAYPFSLGWRDLTNNIVGLPEQLILPDFPASPAGQRAFVEALRSRLLGIEQGRGLCYWGAEWVAWKGTQATDGSPWENQALFDFDHRALPALEALGRE